MLELVKEAGSDVVGLDWHVNLGKARDILGDKIAVQGNLDPTVLYAPKPYIEKEVQRILDENAGRPGFVITSYSIHYTKLYDFKTDSSPLFCSSGLPVSWRALSVPGSRIL